MSTPAALGEEHKQSVKRWITEVRRDLQLDFEGQLQRLGLRDDGQHLRADSMALSDADRHARRRLEALLAHDDAGEGAAQGGYHTVLRELTYTMLNRLLGLKAMEMRGLLFLPPPDAPGDPPRRTEVLTPIPGQQYSRFLRDVREAGSARYRYADDAEERLLRDALDAAFRHLTTEIALVFDPDHEFACLWPTHAALAGTIARVNGGLPDAAFRAPDFLGWVYQFFNVDEKRRVRAETRGKPRSSYELAVINQFYTPAWVVKALVDNTLGRLWIQMHPDTSLRAGEAAQPGPASHNGAVAADYLVSGTGESIPYEPRAGDGRMQPFKRARDITLLDPACGTMHFGQYAFRLFERMYVEEIERAGDPGWPAQPSVTEPRDIPAAIVENNLFGVDIDPRAIQIASLALLLTAKEAGKRHGSDPSDIRLRRTNLVVANAVPLDEDDIHALVERLKPEPETRELHERLLGGLWASLRHVSELGLLVRAREEVTQTFEEWVEDQARAERLHALEPESGEDRLHSFEDADRGQADWVAGGRRVIRQRAEEMQRALMDALEAAAAETADPEGRLFAEDTARALKLLRLMSRRFDVVVMNPPYGNFVADVKGYVKDAYPLTSNDIYAAFVDRATQVVEPEGYVGALVSSTFVNLTSFAKLRSEILLRRNPLLVMLDLGPEILDDATVEAAAIVLAGSAP